MKRHVDFLSTLYLTWGAIFTLVALAGFALAGGAAAIATAGGPVRISVGDGGPPDRGHDRRHLRHRLIWGALHLWIGRSLRQHHPSARLMALGLAVGNLVLLPFGTALGAYACWVLLKDEGRRLFEGA